MMMVTRLAFTAFPILAGAVLGGCAGIPSASPTATAGPRASTPATRTSTLPPTAAPTPSSTPAVQPSPTAMLGAADAASSVRHFSTALVEGDLPAARRDLAQQFRSGCGKPPDTVAHIACLPQPPTGYLPLADHAVYVTGDRASTAVVFELPSGRVPRTVSLVEEKGAWRISDVSPVQG